MARASRIAPQHTAASTVPLMATLGVVVST
jgi:hypothetical protein